MAEAEIVARHWPWRHSNGAAAGAFLLLFRAARRRLPEIMMPA